MEDDPVLGVHPVEGAAQLAGHGCPLLRREAATLGQGFAAAHADPETAVGKAIVRFGAAEMVGELALRDMTHDADMGVRRLEGTVAVVGAKIAAVPGAAEHRGELAGPPTEHMKDGCELLREQEEAAIGDGLLITQSMDDAVGCGGLVVTRRAAQRPSTSVKRLEIWRQLVPLRALLDSPTNTTKRLRP